MLILARNECDEVKLVDGYVGMTVQKLCKFRRRSYYLTPLLHWLQNHASTDMFVSQVLRVFSVKHSHHSQSFLIIFNSAFSKY
jgi:hypothetical protein